MNRYDRDWDYLHILGIFQYIVAILLAPLMFAGPCYMGLGISELFSRGLEPGSIGLSCTLFGLALLLIGGGLSVGNFLAGRWLRAGVQYKFCYFVALCNLLLVPLGTILGVFTISVLRRPQVADRFF